MSKKTQSSIIEQKDKYWKQLQDSIKEAYGIEPKDVHGQANISVAFYTDQLLRIVKSIFRVKCPINWDKDYMLTNLCIGGFFGVTDTDAGILPLRCSLTGVNVFELPTTMIFANPILGNFQRTIDKDGVVVHINGLIRRNGIFQYVLFYAQKLANCDAAIDVNLFNSKTTEVYGAADKKEADSIKAMYDDMSSGKPAVFVKSNILDSVNDVYKREVKQNFVADIIQTTKRQIIEEFLTSIGINNANTDKRERLNEAEVNSNNEELLVNTAYWHNNIEESCEKVRKMFGVDLEITMPYRTYQNQVTTSSISEQEGDVENVD